MKKSGVLWGIIIACLVGFSCCEKEILETSVNRERIVITALYHEELKNFEALVEDTYPDIDLEMEKSQISTYNGDILRRLKKEHGKDLVFTSFPRGEISDYVMDLSANNFTTRFTNSNMELVRKDGKTIFLPMPSVYRGIVINKTLLDSIGKEIPTTQQEFIDVLVAAKEQGVGVNGEGYCFATAYVDGIMVGRMIMSAAVPDFLGTMEGERWVNSFLSREETAQGSLNEYLQFYVTLAELGCLDASRMNSVNITKDAVDAGKEMAEGTLFACYGSSNLLADIREQNTEDEYVMLPFLSREENQAWVSTNPSSYIGINASLASDEKKLEAALRVLDLFSTVEGQAALLKDIHADTSYLAEPVYGNYVTNTGLEEYVEAGYVYHMDRFTSDMMYLIGKNVSEVCLGRMTMEEAMDSLDAFNQGTPLSQEDEYTLLGTIGNDLLYENYNTRKEETAIGNLIADAIREKTGADMVLFNSGGIRASLYAGDVFTSDIGELLPYSNKLVVLEVTGDVIYQMLENSISEMMYQGTPGGRFLQVSGLAYEFQVKPDTEIAEAGKIEPMEATLTRVTLPDGSILDRTATYRIAVTDYMCGISGYEAAGDDYTMLNVFDDTMPKSDQVTLIETYSSTAADAVIAYIKNHDDVVITVECEGRIVVEEVQ